LKRVICIIRELISIKRFGTTESIYVK
jgi:hypothetical protein